MVPIVILIVFGLLAFAQGFAGWVVFALMIAAAWVIVGRRRRYRGRMSSRRRARRWARDQWIAAMQENAPPVEAPPVATPREIAPAPQPVVNLNRLPADAQKQVDRIRRKADVLGQHPDRFPIGSRDLYVIQHTAADYLPTTVRAFTEVPPWSVETPTADGRTPLQMLHNQLDILESKLDEIADTVRKQRVDNLLANERFLEDNFGRDDRAELTIPR
jgi:hypothetical protein